MQFLQQCFSNYSTSQQLMKHIHFDKFGDSSVLKVKQSAIPIPKTDEVLLKIKATAINRAQLLQRQGRYPPSKGGNDILGLEASGTIIEGGQEIPVMALLNGGGYSQFTNVQRDHVIRLPKNFNFQKGAATCEAWITGYMISKYIGNFKKGQNVMVYAAASGVGTSAIQIINFLGANAIAVSSSNEKLDFCRSLGAQYVINYKTENIAEKVQSEINEKGIDLVLDCVGGSLVQSTLNSLKTDGKWVLYGSMGGIKVKQMNLGILLSKRISLIPTTLKTRSDEYQTQLINSFKGDLLQGFEEEKLKPIIYKTLEMDWSAANSERVVRIQNIEKFQITIINPVKKFQEAHNMMESNENIGKIVIKYI